MKNFSGTLVTAVVVAAVAGYAYFFEFKKGKETEEKKQKDALVLHLEKDKISRLELHRQSGALVLEKQDGVWRLAEPVRDSVDSGAVTALIESLVQEKSDETVVEGDEIGWATYGLDKPVTWLVAKTADGQSEQVKIGAVKSFDGKLYARINEDKKVLLVAASWDVHLSKPVKDVRDKRLLRVDNPSFENLVITRSASGRNERLRLEKKDAGWKLLEGGDSSLPLDSGAIDSYMEKIKNLRADEFVSEDNAGADAKKYGFGAKPAARPQLTIELAKSGQKPFLMVVSSVKPGATDKERKGDDESFRFATSSDSSAIFRVAKSSVVDLEKGASDFYDKRFPFKITQNDVAEVKINAPNLQLEAKKQGESWVLNGADANAKKEIDNAKLTDLVGQLGRMEVARFLGKAAAKGVSADKNKIALLNGKGETLLQLNWGEVFKEKAASGSAPELPPGHPGGPHSGAGAESKYYFVKTSLSDQTFAVADSQIDGLPLKELLKERAAPTAAPNTAPAQAAQPEHAKP